MPWVWVSPRRPSALRGSHCGSWWGSRQFEGVAWSSRSVATTPLPEVKNPTHWLEPLNTIKNYKKCWDRYTLGKEVDVVHLSLVSHREGVHDGSPNPRTRSYPIWHIWGRPENVTYFPQWEPFSRYNEVFGEYLVTEDLINFRNRSVRMLGIFQGSRRCFKISWAIRLNKFINN